MNAPITVQEVKISLRSMRNTCPELDEIYATMLKNLNHQQCDALTFFCNRIWTEHNFPTAWREINPIKTQLRQPVTD